MSDNKDIVDEFKEIFGSIKASAATKKTTKTVEGEALPILTNVILIKDILEPLVILSYMLSWEKKAKEVQGNLKFEFHFNSPDKLLAAVPTSKYIHKDKIIDFSKVCSLIVRECGFLKSNIEIRTYSGEQMVFNLGFLDYKKMKPIYDQLAAMHKSYLFEQNVKRSSTLYNSVKKSEQETKKKEKEQVNHYASHSMVSLSPQNYKLQLINHLKKLNLTVYEDIATKDLSVATPDKKLTFTLPIGTMLSREDLNFNIQKVESLLNLKNARMELYGLQQEIDHIRKFRNPSDEKTKSRINEINTKLDDMINMVDTHTSQFSEEFSDDMLNDIFEDPNDWI